MYKFNPNKLKVIYRQEINKKLLETPRKYTLTHSDKTANLFLTIGKTYDYKSINYNMRDEVFASWEKDDKYYLKVKLEVDNGESLVKVILRNKIFREELPLALKAIVYGDRLMIENNKFLYYSHVIVYFKSKIEKYNIELNNVSFSYNKDDKKILNGISCSIPENKFTALVGPSGGGKSTIARLIARFWDVTDGNITIGGVDIKKIPLAQLADCISFVTQDNFLFNCSLKENIRLGNPKATDEEVYRAAKLAQCDEFVLRLENGYDTTAGEAGGKLSGGEKQRIAIARAILKNAPIVILDEATAFTDPENEAKLQKSISELTKGKTLLVIAHRLSTIKNADQIVVLRNGSIETVGTHNELLNSCPLYLDMWESHIGAKKWAANINSKGGRSAC